MPLKILYFPKYLFIQSKKKLQLRQKVQIQIKLIFKHIYAYQQLNKVLKDILFFDRNSIQMDTIFLSHSLHPHILLVIDKKYHEGIICVNIFFVAGGCL